MTSAVGFRGLCAAVCFWVVAGMAAWAGPLDPSVRLQDVDRTATGGIMVANDGTATTTAATDEELGRLLGVAEPRRGDSWRMRDVEPEARVFFRLAFKAPRAVGTLYVQRQYGGHSVWLLRAGQAATAAPTDATAWEPVVAPPGQDLGCVTLPPGTRTEAILVELPGKRSLSLVSLMAYEARFADIRSGAVLQGRVDELGLPLDNLQAGRKWTNTDLGTGETRLNRPPISELHPAWFVYSWDTPQPLIGVRLQSNATKVEIWSLRDSATGNPSLAPADAWRRVKSTMNGPLITFPELTTRALKVNVVGVDPDHHKSKKGQVIDIDDLRVLRALDGGDPPVFSGARRLPPYEFNYDLDRAGELAMVVNTADGTRVANLVAQVEREPGEHMQTWNLRDARGAYVQPGTYRWSAIIGPRPEVRYVTSVYPNVPVNSPQNSAWLNGHSGTGGWLADHSGNSAIAAGPNGMFMAAGTAESGVSTIETDFEGNKLWGRHNLAPWRGPQMLATHGDGVYAAVPFEQHDQIWYIDGARETHEYLTIKPTQTRHHGMRGMAIHGDKLYIPIVSPNSAWLANAVAAADVDVKQIRPVLLEEARSGKPEDRPNPQHDMLRLLRLTGTPAGHPNSDGLTYISSGRSKERRQHVMIPFLREVPIGTLVYKAEKQTDYSIRFSIAKTDAPYPPQADVEEHWLPFDAAAATGWQSLPAPKQATTRALRITFTRGGEDELAALLDEPTDTGNPLGGGSDVGAMIGGAETWEGRLEGLRILRRRYSDQSAGSTIRVNSGTVAADGSWDAQRTAPLSTASPGIYVLQWDAAQDLRGIAIQEVDGEKTLVDVYTGPPGEIDIAGDEHWQQVGEYKQARRYYYQPDTFRNPLARYVDGTVDFGETYQTRAVRLRVVQQWSEPGHRPYGVREDRGGTDLQPARCRVYGVLPLRYIGDEPAVDPLMIARLEIRDLATKAVTRELPVRIDGPLHVATDGTIYGRQADAIVRVDGETGEATAVVTDLENPREFAIAPNGDLAVWDAATQGTYRYDSAGKRLGVIGTPGGWQAGTWDPSRTAAVRDMAVDKTGQIWVVEGAQDPKRVVLFNPDGSFKREFLGNTNYGGGGSLDRYDRSIVRLRRMQFQVDWETGKSRLADMLFADDVSQRNSFSATDFVATLYQGRKYLVTGVTHPSMSASVVHIYLDEGHTARLVAAMGNGREFKALDDPSLAAKLAGKVPGDYDFEFVDRNGDGRVQPDELTLYDMSTVEHGKRNALYGADRDMGISARYGFRYVPAEVLENGAIVYKRESQRALYEAAAAVGLSGVVYVRKLIGGDWFVKAGGHNAVFTADNQLKWSYPFDHEGVTSLWIAPWKPGWVTHQFVMIGNEKPANSELGEIFVMNSNAGQWSVWTADGILAAQIFLHKNHPDARTLSFPEHDQGMLWENLTMGQEHFSGSFVMTEADGKTYVVAGHNHVSIAEVSGWDRFKRISGELVVTAEDIARQIEWEANAAAREVYERAPVITAKKGTMQSVKEATVAAIVDNDPNRPARFNLAYDDSTLYLYYNVPRLGPLANSGGDDKMLFKSGGGLDFQIATDPAADPERQAPVAGDQRLLITMVGNQPKAVLYVARDPSAAANEKWEVFTVAGGTVTFDRVRLCPEVKIFHEPLIDNGSTEPYGYEVTVAVPLATLGLKPKPGMDLRMDWGILITDSGNELKRRIYWANSLNTGTSDAAMEARLRPRLWGHLRFPPSAEGPGRVESLLNAPDEQSDGMLEDLLEEL